MTAEGAIELRPTRAAVLAKLRRLQPDLRRRYPIKEMGVFGSYARDEQTADSDLDVLVDFDAPIGLFDFVGLQQELADHLGLTVDLVMKDAPAARVRDRILAEVVML